MVDPRHDRADEIRAKPLLVQTARHQVGHGLRRDLALLAQAVHVYFVAEEIRHGGDVGGESREPEVDVAVGEDFWEVIRYREGLEAEAQVAGYGDAVFADHGDAGAAVWEREFSIIFGGAWTITGLFLGWEILRSRGRTYAEGGALETGC